jgi:hypothetical protein
VIDIAAERLGRGLLLHGESAAGRDFLLALAERDPAATWLWAGLVIEPLDMARVLREVRARRLQIRW